MCLNNTDPIKTCRKQTDEEVREEISPVWFGKEFDIAIRVLADV